MASDHVLFEEEGSFKAGTVLQDAQTSLQVEAASGKRTKVKAANVLLRFSAPGPGELIEQAQRQAEEIDVDFLWECAPQEEFDYTALADAYYGHAATPVEAASLLMRLHGAPVYFYRKGKGRYKPAPPETLRAALAAVERKRQQEQRVDDYSRALRSGELPEAIAREAGRLLARPDKNSVEYRALERACAEARCSREQLLLQAGAFADEHELHLQRFLAEHFPAGAEFPPQAGSDVDAASLQALPAAPVAAFSIDDSSTTEIDDCLSVQPLADGAVRVGVHIAAPALGSAPGDALDRIARERMSTVYMPAGKITMLPPQPIDTFSLAAGRQLPALSLYVDFDPAGRILQRQSRIERLTVDANLRHDALDSVVTEQSLADPQAPLPQADALRALWRLTLTLSAERDRVRGKPEPRHRLDFNFHVDGDTVRIVPRRRDAPLDRIVAEMMILANSEWGRLLAEHDVPGIYRSQANGRVRMTTHPLAHQGLGVAQYCWATSPLRRYVDLVNQRQLLAVVRGEPPAFSRHDADLFAVISQFDAKYTAYVEFQQRMERYWCLRWIGQHDTRRFDAVVVRDDLVRLARAPLYFRLADVPLLAPGRRIVVDVLECDLLELSVQARFVDVGAAEPVPDEDAGEPVEAVL
ncbi:MAG TPA: RNB domain-containing ribonuclease [Burkholderiaceae bacterium]|nr:RNB domain-containing ribonuclease [Burkholderiaceae bacterium]